MYANYLMFIFRMHYQIAIGRSLIITNITMKPYNTQSIFDCSNRNHTIITVYSLLLQLKTSRCDTLHLTLVTRMRPVLFVLVFRLVVHRKLALETSHIGAEVAIESDPFMLETLVLFKTCLRLGSILAKITWKDGADWKVNL